MTDGLSNILLFSEVRTRAALRDQRGAWALPWAGSSLLSFDMHHIRFFSRYGETYVPNPTSQGLTQRPNNPGPNVDMLYACPEPAVAQLEGMPCDVWQANPNSGYLSAAPRSLHPGGVVVAFMDGHVGFLPNEVNEFAMAYLVSVDDGHPVDLTTQVR